MTISTEDLLNSIMESFDRIDYIKTADIPNIDLYMDQVTTFMDHRLKSTTRQETDKILTKTMINNYAKNDQERRRTDTFRYLRRSFPDGRKRDPDTEKGCGKAF